MNGNATLSRPQTAIWLSRAPLNLNMAGQRAGKSQMIGFLTGQFAINYPSLRGFIGANTYMQLTQSTLVKVFEIWKDLYHMEEYNAKSCPTGCFVVDKQPPAHFIRNSNFKDYNNIISFWNGHVIYVGSLDNYKAHDGKEFAYAHLDETKDTKEDAVKSVILARLSQGGLFIDPTEQDDTIYYFPEFKRHAADIEAKGLVPWNPTWIHTSPAVGQVDWLIQMFDLDKHEREIKERIQATLPDGRPDYFRRRIKYKDQNNEKNCFVVIFSTFHNKENVPKSWFDSRFATLSENEILKFVYGYPFAKTGGEYYPRFSRQKTVTKVPYVPGYPIHQTWDFNVKPYMTMLCFQIIPVDRFIDRKTGVKYSQWTEGLEFLQAFQVRFFKEYCLSSPYDTVQAVCEHFKQDFAHASNNGVFYYGDASGKNRIPGMGQETNFKNVAIHMHRFLHNDSDRVCVPNIGVFKRRDFMNRIFEGKVPEIELFIDEEMTETIRDMEFLKQGKDGKLKELYEDPTTHERYQKLGHTSDATEYGVCTAFREYMKID